MKFDPEEYTLQELGDIRRLLDQGIWDRVQMYRSAGEPWRVVAEELRISTGEAHRRYRIHPYAFPASLPTSTTDGTAPIPGQSSLDDEL